MLRIRMVIAHLKFKLNQAFQSVLHDLTALSDLAKESFSTIFDLNEGLIVVFLQKCKLFEYEA